MSELTEREEQYLNYLVEIREASLATHDAVSDFWLGAVIGEPGEIVGLVESRMAQLADLLPNSTYKDSPIEGSYYHAKKVWQEAAGAVSALVRLRQAAATKEEEAFWNMVIQRMTDYRDDCRFTLELQARLREADVNQDQAQS